jgi:DNA primase
MPIPQHFIDELLDRVDIVEVIDKSINLKKTGKNFSACCPFHDEKTPSFSVNPDKQFFYCFGCGAGGNSIGFIMDYEKLDFPSAVETLASYVGLEVPRENKNSSQNQEKIKDIYDALNWAANRFQMELRNNPNKDQAIKYLKERGLSGEIARDFGIGYAPSGWNNLLKAAKNENKPSINILENCGMLIKKNNEEDYYDRFRERIMFPIRDNRGRVIAFGGRVLNNNDKPKYLNSPETQVFHKQRELFGLYEARRKNQHLDSLILVEGYMDVISLSQFGINNSIATLGTSGSENHLEKIFRHTNKLIISFDGDAAGKKAAQRLLDISLSTMKDGREIFFLFLPNNEDPDTFVRTNGKDAFIEQINNAQPLEDFLFETAEKDIDITTDSGKAKLSKIILPKTKKLPDGIYKQLLLNRLSKKTGLSVENFNQSNIKKNTTQKKAIKEKVIVKDNISIGLEKTPIVWAISLLIHYPNLANEEPLPKCFEEIKTPEAKLLNKLIKYILEEKATLTTNQLLGHWHGTPEAKILNHCANRHEVSSQIEIAKKEFFDTVKCIEVQFNRSQREQILSQIEKKEFSQLSEEEKEMLKSLNKGIK